MITLLSLFAFLNVSFATPEAPCANFAKFGAIRAYKAEMGTIQGSDGIEYEATLTGTRGELSSYVVAISDNNEDGETWTVKYSVVVRKTSACSVVSVKRI
jgi:hypothetical protein